MVEDNIKGLMLIGVLALALLFFEGSSVLQSQQIVIQEDDPSAGNFAIAWWNSRSDLEQNIVIWGGVAVIAIIVLKLLTKGG